MTVFLAWTDAGPDVVLSGPWAASRVVADGLMLIDTDTSLSTLYHELKWSLPDGAALFVTEIVGRPKFRGLRSGALSWLRQRGSIGRLGNTSPSS